MLRATTCVLSIRTLVLRRLPMDMQIAAVSQCPTNFKNVGPILREPCPPPPPPEPKPPKSDALLWGTVAALLVTGTFIAYCKSSPQMRDWLTLHAPYVDELIAFLYQEDMPYTEYLIKSADQIKQYLTRPAEPQVKDCSLPPTDELKNLEEIEPKPEPVDPDCVSVAMTNDLKEMEKCMQDFGESIVTNLNTATKACKDYNNLVAKEMENFHLNRMQMVREAMEKRIQTVNSSVKDACDAFKKLESLSKFFDCSVQATKEEQEKVRSIYKSFMEKARNARIRYQLENDMSLAVDRQWQNVEKVMSNYVHQNESMFPELKYDAKHLNFNGDIDVLLYHTARYMHGVEEDLKVANQYTLGRINRALENMIPSKDENDRKKINAKIENTLKQKQYEADANYTKRAYDLKAENDKHLKELLAKQKERHEKLLEQKLAAKEKEFELKYDSLVQEEVDKETQPLKAELAAMAEKLRVVEKALNERLKAERDTRRSQDLWAAGAALLAATRKGDPYVLVNKELQDIEKAADGDNLVNTVLKSIPPSVREKGLVPESVLKANYHQMEKVALNVALVEAEGAPLHVYILSWIQNLLLFIKVHGIPQAEYDSPPKEPSQDLDTFDLLQRARFWLEHGNIPAALKHVNSLSGASRAAADRWYQQARAHLEVRQAADAILAHAAAMGLQYIK